MRWLLILALSACSDAPEPPKAPAPEKRAYYEEVVMGVLPNPDSIVFHQVYAIDNGVCGYIDFTNAAGQHEQFYPFLVVSTNIVFLPDYVDSRIEFERLWDSKCYPVITN